MIPLVPAMERLSDAAMLTVNEYFQRMHDGQCEGMLTPQNPGYAIMERWRAMVTDDIRRMDMTDDETTLAVVSWAERP